MTSPTLIARSLSLLIVVVAASTVLVIGVAFQQYPTVSFALATATALLLIAKLDYTPRRRRWEPRSFAQPAVAYCADQRLRLAA